jgi:DNA-binding response OmpR family regulator
MKTIVIMDDEFSLADVLAATLSDGGFRVHVAANGLHGLDLLREHHPDLVILDYMMPLLDGGGVIRAMNKDEHLAAIPVLVMSSLPEATVRARSPDFVSFIRKPFTFDALLAKIEAILHPGE